jgi:glycine cleavage system T protein
MSMSSSTGEFLYIPVESAARGSVLYERHLKLVPRSRLAPFAGYLMPLWYSSISDEHQAVRGKAGIFDCTHMGVLEVAGDGAEEFLNEVTTNDLRRLRLGGAQYGYILDASGGVLDDIIVYRRWTDKFMVVVNAANEAKVRAYLDAILAGSVTIDVNDESRRITHRPDIRDMRDTSCGVDCRCDIAVQGPASEKVLTALANGTLKKELESLKPFTFVESHIGEIDCIISRTGYTGTRTGYELFVHPDRAGELWDMLLEKGAAVGLVPCGLGARDSLRIEAGLPLYGHELDGEFAISPFGAGYGWAVKTDKGFFIGKDAMVKESVGYKRQVVRVELSGQAGIRPVRMHDGILSKEGTCVGVVLSCAKAGDRQVAMAIVTRGSLAEKDRIGAYYIARNARQVDEGRKQQVSAGMKLDADITGHVLTRFEKFADTASSKQIDVTV